MPLPLTSRPAQLAALLTAGFGVPYAYHNFTPANSGQGDRANVPAAIQGFDPSTSPVAITNPMIRDLRQFVRFDITPAWVTSSFPRVSTVLSNVQMDGLRVAVVTGTSTTDFAGTVDYYFDRTQRIRRICLSGNCGDPTMLAAMMTQYFGLTVEPSLGGNLFLSRWNNRVTSLASFQPAPVVYAQDNYSKYAVYIEINQPSDDYGLSETAEQTLQSAWQNLRWR
jgi:hypothetical protein